MPGRGRRGEQEHVPGPTVSTLRVGIVFVNLCSVTEAVAVLVHSIRQFIVQRDPINTEFRKPVKLVRFRDAVVVGVDPQTKLGVDRVAAVDDAVSVTAIFRLVEYRQRQKAIGFVGRGLGSDVSKQLGAIVDPAVAIPVQSKEGVRGTGSSPTYLGG